MPYGLAQEPLHMFLKIPFVSFSELIALQHRDNPEEVPLRVPIPTFQNFGWG